MSKIRKTHPPPALDPIEETLPTAFGAPPAPPAAPEASADDAYTPHPIEQLAADSGASAEEITVLTGAMDGRAILAASVGVTAGRVCDEVHRVAGHMRDFCAFATAARVRSLRLGPVVFRVLVSCAAQAIRLERSAAHSSSEARLSAPESLLTEETDLSSARSERDQLANSLRGLHAGDTVQLERIRLAERPGATGYVNAGPGRALLSLTELAAESLTSADASLRGRAAAWGITETWLRDCARIAARARAVVTRREVPATTERGLKLRVRELCGIAMLLLRRTVSAFEIAHQADPMVPAFAPTYLRGKLVRRRAKPAAKSPEDLAAAAAKAAAKVATKAAAKAAAKAARDTARAAKAAAKTVKTDAVVTAPVPAPASPPA